MLYPARTVFYIEFVGSVSVYNPVHMMCRKKYCHKTKLKFAKYFQTYRKVEQEIKNREKKRKKAIQEGADEPVREETYVDKDRAIVVSTGHSDLKGSIMKHRGRLMNEGKEDFEMNIGVLLEQAEHEMKWGDPEKALAYLEKGIHYKPEDIDCLVLKARCLVDLNRFK